MKFFVEIDSFQKRSRGKMNPEQRNLGQKVANGRACFREVTGISEKRIGTARVPAPLELLENKDIWEKVFGI
jgi:hypothetical protein